MIFAALPLLFLATTSFVKLSFVLSLLRNALGTGQVPSSLVVAVLAAILSLYVMVPVGAQMARAVAPAADRIDWQGEPLQGASRQAVWDALKSGREPLRAFLKRNAGGDELALFEELAKRKGETDAAGLQVTREDFLVVVPAFLITELAEAFEIGFLLFIPFVVIDMVIGAILLALGMHMLSPTSVSLPFKLLLFVLVDGWSLLSRALIVGYQ